MQCLLKSCQKCGGDLVQDTDELRCWQCGNYYYPRSAVSVLAPEPAPRTGEGESADLPGAPRRRRRSRWAMHDINNLIVAKDRSDQRWWARNAQIITHLDAGKTVREIAALVGRSERQVRVVREQLNDLRAISPHGERVARVS